MNDLSGQGRAAAVSSSIQKAPPARNATGIRADKVIGMIVTYALFIVGGALAVLPFVWLIATSFRTYQQVLVNNSVFWPESFYLGNWSEAVSSFPFFQYLRNTMILTLVGVAGTILSSTLVAYGFARFKTWWMPILFTLMLASIMVPAQVTTIPLYIQYVQLGWINTFWPLTIPTFFGSAFGIFLLRQFFLAVPRDLADAAVIDGATEIGVFRHVYLPLATAPIAALVVLDFLGRWNDLYGPTLYLQTQDNFTLQQGLQFLMAGTAAGSGSNAGFGAPWNLMAAAATLTALPIIVIFFMAQRYFIEGIKLTGIK